MALVIKKWSAQTTKDSNGNYVHIVGRESGLISWLLSKLTIDPTTTVEIKSNIVMFSQGSLGGSECRVIPLNSICSAYYGYTKPWKTALAIGVTLLPAWGIGLIVGPIYYFLNKELTVGFVEHSGVVNSFSFKRSIIEGQNIDEDDAKRVIDLIRALIEGKTTKPSSQNPGDG